MPPSAHTAALMQGCLALHLAKMRQLEEREDKLRARVAARAHAAHAARAEISDSARRLEAEAEAAAMHRHFSRQREAQRRELEATLEAVVALGRDVSEQE